MKQNESPASPSPAKVDLVAEFNRARRRALVMSLLAPLLVLVFYLAAPPWLNSKLRSQSLQEIDKAVGQLRAERERRKEFFGRADFQKISREPSPGLEQLRASLQRSGISGHFTRLRWCAAAALVMSVVLISALVALLILNRRARESQAALIRHYRWSWRICMAAALVQLLLLVPLLTYGSFEATVLLTDSYFPKLIAVTGFLGLVVLWRSATILLSKVPLEFKEPLSRALTPEEAPEMWQAIRGAADRLQTAPPVNILVGMQLNFYVTEMAVVHSAGRVAGRTLYLSYPLMKQLSEPELLAIVGHELGHFIGDDTRMTREFYPLRWKVHETVGALAQSSYVGWASFQFLNFFRCCFAETEQTASRFRELLADRKGAELTSPQTAAHALVKFQVLVEAFNRGMVEAVEGENKNILDAPLQPIIREKLLAEAGFWPQLFEKKLPHPLDSHPALHVRLESLGQNISVADAQALAAEQVESAFVKWFAERAGLFAAIRQEADAVVDKMRAHSQVTQADYSRDAGRELLTRYFPEKKWRVTQSGVWTGAVLMGLGMAGCLAGAIFINGAIGKLIFLIIAALLGILGRRTWVRHRRAEFFLTAGGVNYTGWNRPVSFQDVAGMSFRKQYSNVTMTLRLKARQPAVWKFSLPRIPTKSVSVSLNGMGEKPVAIAQTVHRYFTRQLPE